MTDNLTQFKLNNNFLDFLSTDGLKRLCHEMNNDSQSWQIDKIFEHLPESLDNADLRIIKHNHGVSVAYARGLRVTVVVTRPTLNQALIAMYLELVRQEKIEPLTYF